MTFVYKTTLSTILYLCKFVGIINITYVLNSDGLLIQSTDSIYKFLEIARLFMLIISSYSIHKSTYFTQKIFLFKVWSVIIASRISETWIIRLMNGVIEYDQKLTSLPRCLMIRQLLPKKNYWNIIFIFTLIYYIASTLLMVYLWPPKIIDITTIVLYFIRIDFIMDVTVIFSSYFFLQQLEYRFQTLNDSWEYLLPGFSAVPGELTQSITGMTLDKIRLLHSELSDLLRIFSVGFGKMLLGFFVFSFINIILSFYYSIIPPNNMPKEFNFDRYILIEIIPYLLNLQNVIWTLSIIIAASRVHEKKRKMISYLRSIKISNLSANLKTQVKFFMNQISVFELSELTAFGIFSINSNLVVSILILLVTGLITIIQMKEHPVLLQSKENLKKFMQDISKGKLNI